MQNQTPAAVPAVPPATAAKPDIMKERAGHLNVLKGLLPYVWPAGRPDLKVRIVLAFITLLAGKFVTLLMPYTFKWAVDWLTANGPTKGGVLVAVALTPMFFILAYGLVRVSTMFLSQLRDVLFTAVGQHAVRQLSFRTFEHLHRLSLRFHLERRTGAVSRIIERGTEAIDTIIRMGFLNSIPTVVEFVAILGILWATFGIEFSAIVLVMILAYLWFTFAASEWRIGIRREMNESDRDANAKAVDSLLNYETVKYFGNEEMEVKRYDRSMARYEQAAIRTYYSLGFLNAGQAAIFTIGLTICMLLSARQVMAGQQTVGDFVLLNVMLGQFYIPLNFMGMVYREIKQGLIDLETMFRLLDEKPEIPDRPDARPLAVDKGAVRFEGINFHYDPARPILKNVSFEVPAGQMVAIVGPSGAGKSTISRILFRFYDVASGRVLIDGQDIRGVTQKSLRAAIGVVPQDTVLFNDTIYYNISYGRPDASKAEVEEAARQAQIHDFVSKLPEGYQTQVGERGLKLSGGEKQRVAIARTILKGPPILMLDEATSALDSRTEREIQGELDRVSKNRTTLVIAHRLSTIVNADNIIVLDDGVIVEQGRHQDLVGQGGLYASMWSRQREADEAREKLASVLQADSKVPSVKAHGTLVPVGAE